jgi:hypothetical protein
MIGVQYKHSAFPRLSPLARRQQAVSSPELDSDSPQNGPDLVFAVLDNWNDSAARVISDLDFLGRHIIAAPLDTPTIAALTDTDFIPLLCTQFANPISPPVFAQVLLFLESLTARSEDQRVPDLFQCMITAELPGSLLGSLESVSPEFFPTFLRLIAAFNRFDSNIRDIFWAQLGSFLETWLTASADIQMAAAELMLSLVQAPFHPALLSDYLNSLLIFFLLRIMNGMPDVMMCLYLQTFTQVCRHFPQFCDNLFAKCFVSVLEEIFCSSAIQELLFDALVLAKTLAARDPTLIGVDLEICFTFAFSEDEAIATQALAVLAELVSRPQSGSTEYARPDILENLLIVFEGGSYAVKMGIVRYLGNLVRTSVGEDVICVAHCGFIPLLMDMLRDYEAVSDRKEILWTLGGFVTFGEVRGDANYFMEPLEECGGIDLLKEIALSEDPLASHVEALLDELFEREDAPEEEEEVEERW